MNTTLRSVPLLAAALVATLARADVAYSNLGSPVAYQPYQSSLVGNPVQAVDGFLFTAGASGTLAGFQVAMNDSDYDGPLAYTLQLCADRAGVVGAPMGSYPGTSTGLLLGDSTSALSSVAATGAPVSLVAGTSYWLLASSPNTLFWNKSNAADGPRYYSNGSGSGYNLGSGAFSVQVNPTPEPSALAALGLGAVGLLRRRKRA